MTSKETIRDAVIQAIEKVSSRENISLGDADKFSDHDIDSLDRMSMMLEVETSLEIDFDDLDPKALTCIDDYVKHIQSM